MQHREIERAVYSGILEPSADWHSLTHEGSRDRDLRLTYRVRVQCEPNYYNATCTKFCRPRNDMFGHYDCDRNGDKTCMPGWTGATCETGHSRPHFNFFFKYHISIWFVKSSDECRKNSSSILTYRLFAAKSECDGFLFWSSRIRAFRQLPYSALVYF